MTTDTNDELETKTPLTDTNGEHGEIETRPDLVWDKEAPGLCVRVYGDGSKSFILVYRVDDRQRLLKIGRVRRGRLRQPASERKNFVPSSTRAATLRPTITNAIRFAPSRTSSDTSPKSLPKNPRRVGRREAVLADCCSLLSYATACAFRFLRQPSRKITPLFCAGVHLASRSYTSAATHMNTRPTPNIATHSGDFNTASIG